MLKRTVAILLVVLLCVALGSGSARGREPDSATATTTVVLQRGNDGYLGCRDTTLFQYAPDANYQLLQLLRTGYKRQYASLIEFDLAPIPADATITQAVLQLYAVSWSGSGLNVVVDAYAILRDVRTAQGTWNQWQTGMPWAKPGCGEPGVDRRATAESTVTTHGIEQWYSFDLTALTQDWRSGSQDNNGVLLQTRDVLSGNSFQWASAQHTTASLRPKLVVTYQSTGDGTATPTRTATRTGTRTATATATATRTLSGDTPTLTGTPTRTRTPTASFTLAASLTPTRTRTKTPTSGSAEITTILQQGVDDYLGCGDTHIYLYDNGKNLCTNTEIRLGYRQQYAALIRFLLSSLPADAVISQATLQLYATGWSGVNMSIAAYAVLRSMGPCQATWYQSQTGSLWDVPGANGAGTDRRASPDASITTSGIFKWYSFDLTSLVQEWANGSLANNGVALRDASSGSNADFYFASAQSSDVSLHPKLVVTYRTGSAVNTPTSVSSATATPTRTVTPTFTRTSTAGPSPTRTASATQSATPTVSPTATVTRTRTPTPIGAETTVSLRQGVNAYAGCRDTYMFQYSAEANFCGHDALMIGYKQQYAGLIRFDLSSIPGDAEVIAASLRLYGVGWSGSSMPVGTYAVIRDWMACQATWNQARSVDPWSLPGCQDTALDRAATSESAITATGINAWYSFNLTSLVQRWLDGSLANHGVYLRGESAYSISTFSFASADNGNVTFRPQLDITYRVGPAPTPSAVPTLIIGHITDPHIGVSAYYATTLAKVVVSVSQQANVLVDTGDCTENGTAEESAEYSNLVNGNASIPWRATIGNHDTPVRFQQYIGPLEWSLDLGNYRLIGINTESINYTTLDQALTHDKPCIVFGHFPLSWCTPADQAQLRMRFEDYQVPIYIAGHTHLDSLITDAESGTLLLTGQRAGMGHYRLVTLRGFEVESIHYGQSN